MGWGRVGGLRSDSGGRCLRVGSDNGTQLLMRSKDVGELQRDGGRRAPVGERRRLRFGTEICLTI